MNRVQAGSHQRDDRLSAAWRERMAGERCHHLIRLAARAFARSVQLRLGEHSVAFGQWLFFCILWQKDGLTQRELSELAGVMDPTTVAALRGMEKLGFIRRGRKPANQRRTYIYLTAKGRLLKGKIIPIAVEVNDVATEGIGAADLATTRRTLVAMVENLMRDDVRSADQKRRVISTRELGRIISGKAGGGNGRRRFASG